MNIPTKVAGYVIRNWTVMRQNVLFCSDIILFSRQGLDRPDRLSNHKP